MKFLTSLDALSLACWRVDLNKAPLSELLSWCLLRHNVDRLLVAIRTEKEKGARTRIASAAVQDWVKKLFGKHILDSFLASAWPGTQLIDHPGLITVVEFHEIVKEIILKAEPDFRKWLNNNKPPLPEDICLFKATNAHPTLVSVTHEGLAWVIDEKAPFSKGTFKTNLKPQELFWTGRYFCQEWNQAKKR